MKKLQLEELGNILCGVLKEIEKYPVAIDNRTELIREKPILVIYIDVIVRLASHLNLLQIIFRNINAEHELRWLEHSIGISLRSCLQDRIMINEVMHDLDENDGWAKEETKKEVYLKHNSGQIKYIIDLVSMLEKKDFLLNSRIDPKAIKQNLVVEFEDFFTDKNSYKLKQDYRTSVFSSTFISSKNERVKEDGADIFELWEHYSKYEHYGPLSSRLLHMPIKENWNRIIYSLMHVLNTFVYLFDSMPPTTKSVQFMIDKIDELHKLQITE